MPIIFSLVIGFILGFLANMWYLAKKR